MTEKKTYSGQTDTLRHRAEEVFREKAAGMEENMEALSPDKVRQILHELRVHQIELEMQNEELRRAQGELDASRERYFDLYDLAPVGYFTLNEKGLILEVNLTAAILLGVARSALVKQPLTRFILSEDQDIFYRHRKLLFETGAPQVCELRLVKKDDAPFWVRIDATAAQGADGAPVCRATMIDITERKRSEEALRNSEERLRDIIFSIADWVWEVDKNGVYTYSSQKRFNLLAESPIDIIGKTPFDFMPPDEAKRVAAIFSEIVANKTPINDLENWNIGRNGERICLLTNGVPILDEEGNLRGYRGVDKDITERKQSEKKLEDTLESLRKAVATTIQVMVSAVETRDPYTAGHQIRSANLARAIAIEMELPPEKIDGIRMAGSIHDIGKLSIPAEILSKPTKLSDIEFRLIKEHARQGYEMLKDVESPWPLAEIVHQHHERMDGSGYPRNLKGEEICMEARILNVADVVEAMASHRPYRAGLGINAALNEIEKNRGTFYDHAVADACLRLFREKGFKLEGT